MRRDSGVLNMYNIPIETVKILAVNSIVWTSVVQGRIVTKYGAIFLDIIFPTFQRRLCPATSSQACSVFDLPKVDVFGMLLRQQPNSATGMH